jgi:hypothetical protein
VRAADRTMEIRLWRAKPAGSLCCSVLELPERPPVRSTLGLGTEFSISTDGELLALEREAPRLRLRDLPLKLAATISRALQADMQAKLRDIERAVATGTRDAGRSLRTELRRQVTSVGLGQLANSWRDRHYANQRLDAASLVYTKAPQIVRAFDEGAVIRSRRERFLAIPTENAPRKGIDGRRIKPSTFPEHRFGPLRFVPRPSGPSLLVVDGLRASLSRQTGDLRGFRRATDRARRSGQGLTTVVMFLLVPRVKLRKRLDVAGAAERWSGQLPALIERQLRSE